MLLPADRKKRSLKSNDAPTAASHRCMGFHEQVAWNGQPLDEKRGQVRNDKEGVHHESYSQEG
jgi:hypothetical protein